jgi:hypothetical protein
VTLSVIVVIVVDIVEDTVHANGVDMIVEQRCLTVLGVDV